MGFIHPFRGLVPARHRVEAVISKPFDTYTSKEVEAVVKSNPDSFLNIIKPELANGKRTRPDNPEAQQKSREKFLRFLENGILEKQTDPVYYIYRQVKPHFVYTGLIATIDATAYRDGRIKIHEQTLAPKEEKLKDYLRVVGINAEPVMFTYPHRHDIDELMNRLTAQEPYTQFSFDGKEHFLWVVSHQNDIAMIQQEFDQLGTVYVADGHHRSASSVLLAEEAPENTPAKRFMGIFLPDHNLQLFEFNRLVKDTGDLTLNEILGRLEEDFEVDVVNADVFKPGRLHEFSMYMNGKWFKLNLKLAAQNNQLGDKLDANILTQRILAPLFEISDLRNDTRIGFLSGLKGPEEMKAQVDSRRYALALGLFPVSFQQFFSFSDQGKMMPPKTTWFEPKLLNGLVIYDLENEAHGYHRKTT